MPEAFNEIVIVGAGLAGDRCAFTLREEGFDGKITLVGEEIHRPYDRPPLSKSVLKSAGEEDGIFFHALSDYDEAKIDLRLGQRATGIDLGARRIELKQGGHIPFDRLVLATGSSLKTLSAFPPGAPGVFYLRGMTDALALRDAFGHRGRVIVVGGGVIGLEAAAAASAKGLDVTVIEAAPRIMSRASGPAISDFLHALHTRAGVRILCDRKIVSVDRTGVTWRVSLDDGSEVNGEIVIVGIGVAPEVALAKSAGVASGPHGVVVDEMGKTDNDAIFAAGEGAYHLNAFSGRHERQENWGHAAAHGDLVARSILGGTESYAEIPSFWTDQFNVSLKGVGLPTAEIDVVRGDPENEKFVVFHLQGDKVVGASGINATRELRAAKALIKSRKTIDPKRLADTSIDVAQAAL
jgi:3-phenylpropionate/trans-cinnamate dioxygenase ferredoxin reductase subunit